MHFIMRETIVSLQHQHLNNTTLRRRNGFNFIDSVVVGSQQEFVDYVRDPLIRRKSEQTVFVYFPRIEFARR